TGGARRGCGAVAGDPRPAGRGRAELGPAHPVAPGPFELLNQSEAAAPPQRRGGSDIEATLLSLSCEAVQTQDRGRSASGARRFRHRTEAAPPQVRGASDTGPRPLTTRRVTVQPQERGQTDRMLS